MKSLKAVFILFALTVTGCEEFTSYYLIDFDLVGSNTSVEAPVSGHIKCEASDIKNLIMEKAGSRKMRPRSLVTTQDPFVGGLAWYFRPMNFDSGFLKNSCSLKSHILFVDQMNMEAGTAKATLATVPKLTGNENSMQIKPVPIQHFDFMCSYQTEKYDGVRRKLITCASADGSWITLSSRPSRP